MVQRQLAPDFLDSKHEWHRVFAEAWGTFLLVVVAAGGGVVAAKSRGAVSLGMIVVAPGLIVMATIYFMGTVSGAHLNPAVTLALAVRRKFPWGRVPGYVPAQMIGGIAAARGPLGGADQRRLDEPGAIIGTGPGARRPRHGVDLCGRISHWRVDRRRLRVDTEGHAHN
jgi:Major intrinsic protein